MAATQKFSNSPLVVYTKLSPNHSGKRTKNIDTISIHTMAGNLTIESCGNLFAKKDRKASSNYGIGSDGRIGMYVEECNRSWCTSSALVDQRAVTIEIASLTSKDPYKCSDKAYEALINLCADICKRNNIKELKWKNDKSLLHQPDKQNMVPHRWLAAKSCLPIYDTELLTKHGWIRLADVKIGDEVATVNPNDLSIVFDEIYDVVEPYKADVYKNLSGLMATLDHRVVYTNINDLYENPNWKITEFENILNNGYLYIPTAGNTNYEGLGLSDDFIKFLVAVQADGHYMYETLKNGDKSYYGLEFHLKKERKLRRIKDILNNLKYEFNINNKSDGSVSIRIYNKENFKIRDICEEYLHSKDFTWKLLFMNKHEAEVFMNELIFWDGSLDNHTYFTFNFENFEIVSAICALHEKGSYINLKNKSIKIYNSHYTGLSRHTIKYSVEDNDDINMVGCVSVPTGLILIRQNGRTFIVGNCPGQYLFERYGDIANKVNAILNGDYKASEIQEAKSSNTISNSNEKVIWNYLKEKGLSEYAVAGIMGNIFAESGVIPNNLQNSFNRSLNMADEEYTKKVDDGSYKKFISDKAGYGLCQWTLESRKEKLYNFAKQRNVSISDMNMQLEFLWNEMQDYLSMMKVFSIAKSVKECSDAFLTNFERPADMSDNIKSLRASYAEDFYKKNHKENGVSELPYKVKVNDPTGLNIRKGPGTNFDIVGKITDNGIYTIIEEADGKGAKRWGKLKSGSGFISLDYCIKIS